MSQHVQQLLPNVSAPSGRAFAGRYEFVAPIKHKSQSNALIGALDHRASEIYTSIFSQYASVNGESGVAVLTGAALRSSISDLDSLMIPRSRGINEASSMYVDRSGNITRDAFVTYCCEIYGAVVAVTLKFISDEVNDCPPV
jgi:hypothetical protein